MATLRIMATQRIRKTRKNDDFNDSVMLSGKKYKDYMRDYNKRMKRLHREASGSNMEAPPEADYGFDQDGI